MSHCLAICGIRFQALTSVLGSIAISPYLFKLISAHVQTVYGTLFITSSQLHFVQALIDSTCLVHHMSGYSTHVVFSTLHETCYVPRVHNFAKNCKVTVYIYIPH